METAYHPDFGQRVNYSFDALPEAPDGQVRSTIRKVIRYCRTDALSPEIQDEARKMLSLGNGDPNLGVWNLLKPAMKFKQDEKIAADLQSNDPRIPDTIEVLIRPRDQWLLIHLRGLGIGDCDCFSMYAACLLQALEVPCSLCTVAADKDRPREYSHVYLVSYWNGVRTPLDISHGPEVGWECPNLGRLKEWPVNLTVHEMLTDSAVVIGGLGAAYFGFKWLTKERAA